MLTAIPISAIKWVPTASRRRILKGSKMTNATITHSVTVITKANVDAVNATAKTWEGNDHTREANRRKTYIQIGRIAAATLQALGMTNWSYPSVKTAVEDGKIDCNAGRLLETMTNQAHRNTLRSNCVWLVMNPDLVEAYDKHVAETKKKNDSLGGYITSAKRWDKENNRDRDRSGEATDTNTPEDTDTDTPEATDTETPKAPRVLADMSRDTAVSVWSELLKLAHNNDWDLTDLQNDAWEASGLKV